jgi:hypothetical protein
VEGEKYYRRGKENSGTAQTNWTKQTAATIMLAQEISNNYPQIEGNLS